MAVISKRDGEEKMPDAKASLRFALEAIDRIERYVHGLSYTEFRRNQMCQDAVVFRLRILGHMLTNLLEGRKGKSPWEAIAPYGSEYVEITRDYTAVNPQSIWEAVAVSLPRLKNELLALESV